MIPPSLCVIGELLLDRLVYLDNLSAKSVDTSPYIRTEIHDVVGGAGLQAAAGGIQHGFMPVSLIAKLGCDSEGASLDAAGQKMLNQLQHLGISPIILKDRERPSGNAIVVYFSDGPRLMAVDRGANASFNKSDITAEIRNTAAKSDVFYISGYWLLDEEQRDAVKELARIAKSNNRLVILDVVPHRIYETLNEQAFREVTCDVDILISGMNTLVRLFSISQSADMSGQEFEKHLVSHLLMNYKGILIRPSDHEQVLYSQHGLLERRDTNRATMKKEERLGFLDRAAMKMLFDYYDNFRDHSQ